MTQKTWGDNPEWGRTGDGGRPAWQNEEVSCVCATQAAQPVAVSVSTRTRWDALGDASGPAALVVQPEELLGRAAAPVQPLQCVLSGGPDGVCALVRVLRDVPRLSITETAISSRA